MELFKAPYRGIDFTQWSGDLADPQFQGRTRFFKAVLRDYRPATNSKEFGPYAIGKVFRPLEKIRHPQLCTYGVLHASYTPAQTLYFYCDLMRPSCVNRLLIVEGNPVVGDAIKVGFTKLKVVQELPHWRAFGQNGRQLIVLRHLTNLSSDEIPGDLRFFYESTPKRIMNLKHSDWPLLFSIQDRIDREGYTRAYGFIRPYSAFSTLQLIVLARPILRPRAYAYLLSLIDLTPAKLDELLAPFVERFFPYGDQPVPYNPELSSVSRTP